MGTYLFMAGSMVVIVAQVWKISRNIVGNPIQYLDTRPETTDIEASVPPSITRDNEAIDVSRNEVFFVNWSAFIQDLWIACAAFSYLAGSFLFLPSYANTDYDTTEAANWFVFAGFFYFIGSVTMIYRYFFTKEYV
jgi:hypothetical protein